MSMFARVSVSYPAQPVSKTLGELWEGSTVICTILLEAEEGVGKRFNKEASGPLL